MTATTPKRRPGKPRRDAAPRHGKHANPRRQITATPEEWERWDKWARGQGLSWAQAVRAKLNALAL